MRITRRQLRNLILNEIESMISGQVARLKITPSGDSDMTGQSILYSLFGEDGASPVDVAGVGDVHLEKIINVDGDTPGGIECEVRIDVNDSADVNTLTQVRDVISDLVSHIVNVDSDMSYGVDLQGVLID